MTTMPSGTIKGMMTSWQTVASTDPATFDMSASQTGTSVSVGDFVFILISSGSGLSTTKTPGPPTGFTEIVAWQAMGTSTTTCWAIYAKRRETGDTDYDIPQTNLGYANNSYATAVWIDGSNAQDVANWTVGTIGTRAGSGGTVDNIAPSITTTDGNTMVVGFSMERTTATETDESQYTVSGTGWTKNFGLLGNSSGAGSTGAWGAYNGVVTAGASGDVTFTAPNGTSANGAALQIAIPATTDPPPSTVSGSLWNGTSVDSGYWYVCDGAGGVDSLSWAGMMHPGYASIDAMLAETFFYCGHRGGSRNWPEMSLQGYTQAALRGYGALEVSLARTSDGVWFGLHDSSLDRTSLGTSGTTLLASSMTWTEVQTYDMLPATGAPVDSTHRPYMELSELLDAYMKTHVIFVDPKSAQAYRDELIAILKTYRDWDTKIVAKSVPGNSNNAWLVSARAAGFVTNAMFYEADDTTTYQDQGDILGMAYYASSGAWSTITGFGKPVMCHVCPDTTSVSTGQALGATGAIVSGPVQVPLITL